MRLFLRSLNSSFLKVWPCGPLRTEYSGEFLRHSSSKLLLTEWASLWREPVSPWGALWRTHLRTGLLWAFPAPPGMCRSITWVLAVASVVSPLSETPRPCMTILMGNDGILGKWGTLVEFRSFPTTFLGKLWGKLLVFSPLIPDCHPSALGTGICQYALWSNCFVGFCVWTTCLMDVSPS